MKKVLIPTLAIVALFAIVSWTQQYEWIKQGTQNQKIGFGSVIGATNDGSIAVSSCDGMAYVGANSACQIGTGSNATENSFQYRSSVILDGDGGLGVRVYGIMRLKYIFWEEDWVEGGYCPDLALASESDPAAKISEVADRGAWLMSVTDGDSDGDEIVAIIDDGPNGILMLETTDKADDCLNMQLNGEMFRPGIGTQLWFNCRVAIEDVDKDNMFIGLATADTDILGSLPNDCIGFQMDGDGNIDYHCSQDGTDTTGDTGVDMEDGVYVTLAFYWDGVSTVTFAVNGTTVATVVDDGATIYVPDDEALSPIIAVDTSDTGKDYMLCDYIGCWIER